MPTIDGGGAGGPVRSCVGCRRRRPWLELARITSTAAGIGVDGASDGRGAWLCRADGRIAAQCVERAISTGGFARVWRRQVGEDELRRIRDAVDAYGTDADAH